MENKIKQFPSIFKMHNKYQIPFPIKKEISKHSKPQSNQNIDINPLIKNIKDKTISSNLLH